MRVEINATGFLNAYRKAPNIINREIKRGVKHSLVNIQRDAAKTHRFITRSGNLERATMYDLDDSGLSGRVYLDTGVAIYGPRIHKGWGTWSPDRFVYAAARRQAVRTAQIIGKAVGEGIRKAGF